MVKFKEAEARLFKGTVVCRKCKSKMKASSMKVRLGKVSCRKCGSKALRPIKKK